MRQDVLYMMDIQVTLTTAPKQKPAQDKLKFGHHGCNHPVKDLATGRIEISSQNHGFHVVLDGVPDVEATHVNHHLLLFQTQY